MNHSKLREEFIKDWSGENPSSAIELIHSKMADWWLSHISTIYKDIETAIEKEISETQEKSDVGIRVGLRRAIDILIRIKELKGDKE